MKNFMNKLVKTKIIYKVPISNKTKQKNEQTWYSKKSIGLLLDQSLLEKLKLKFSKQDHGALKDGIKYI